MVSKENEKRIAAEAAAEYVQSGMIIGLGTGSTAAYAIKKLGVKVKSGLKIQGIPTSEQTRILAESAGIPLIDFSQTTKIDLTIDGADEIDNNFNMIKGGGGALLREKIVASISDKVIIVADSGKDVDTLGKFPLPVEVSTFGWQVVAERISSLGSIRVVLRKNQNSVYLSDNGNYILDCYFDIIHEPIDIENIINQIPGVVVNGLFIGLANIKIIGNNNRVDITEQKK